MYKNIRDIFNNKVSVSIDTKLLAKIEAYINRFITKDIDSANFFGGSLTGVNKVIFSNADRSKWFEEILEITEDDVIDHCAEFIDPLKYQVASDCLSLSCVWLAHSIYHSTKIPKDKKEKGMADCILVMLIRFVTSRMNRHWPYPCSKAVAEATLAAMNNKYSIKRLGSWISVLKERAENTVDMKNSIHKNSILKMDIDMKSSGSTNTVAYVIIDNSTRIKDMLKGIYNLQKNVQASGLKINSTSSTYIETDGESVLKDKEQSLEAYKSYLINIIGDKPSFIKLDLISIIESSNKTMAPQMFRTTLGWLSDNYAKNNQDKLNLDEMIANLMDHLLMFVSQNRNIMKNKSDIPGLISKIKGIYTASRLNDDKLLKVREQMEEVVKRATKVKSYPAIAATRTGVMLYIVLRAFTKNHYS